MYMYMYTYGKFSLLPLSLLWGYMNMCIYTHRWGGLFFFFFFFLRVSAGWTHSFRYRDAFSPVSPSPHHITTRIPTHQTHKHKRTRTQ